MAELNIKDFSLEKRFWIERIKKTYFQLVLVFIYTLFVLSSDFLKTKSAATVWFLVLGIVFSAGLYRYIHHIKTRVSLSKWKSLEFLLPCLLIIESLIQFFGKPLLLFIYIPLIVVISSNFPFKVVISSILAIFLLGLPTQWWLKGYLTAESGSYFAILATGIISYYIFYKKTAVSKKAIEDLGKLKSSALSLDVSTEANLFNEDRFSHLVKSVLDTEKELRDMLNLAKKITDIDYATLFVLEGDRIVVKSSTEDVNLEPALRWREDYLLSAIKEKKPLVIAGSEGDTKAGGSSLYVPVSDGNIVIGVIEMVSRKGFAFGEREKDLALSFAAQIGRMLGKARSYIEVERFAKGFKSLHEASRALSASLKVEEIADKLVGFVSGMISLSAVGFLIPDKGELRVIANRGLDAEKDSFYPKGTYFDLIIKNKQVLLFSHLDRKRGIYPFRNDNIRTFLGIPLVGSENELFGILTLISTEPDAVSSFYGHFLNILADHAALSITNAKLHNEVERLAITDGLTGLYNHKHFQERLNDEFQRIERIPQPISLILIDLDHFKKINDLYGHPSGDAVLVNLALMLKKTLRGIDIIARYGGEEFAAVLLNTESHRAQKIAERLRVKVLNTAFSVGGSKLSLTLSIGIATYPYDAKTKEDLISRADEALYYAKRNGRNQACLWKNIGKNRKWWS